MSIFKQIAGNVPPFFWMSSNFKNGGKIWQALLDVCLPQFRHARQHHAAISVWESQTRTRKNPRSTRPRAVPKCALNSL
eukprot:6471586-Amphidinium_carterae.2